MKLRKKQPVKKQELKTVQPNETAILPIEKQKPEGEEIKIKRQSPPSKLPLSQASSEYFGSKNLFELSPDSLKIKEENDEKIYYKIVSKYIKISKIEQSEETKDIVLTLDYKYNDELHSIEITRDQLQPNELPKLSKKGIDVFYHNVKNIIQFLRIQERDAPYQTVHTHLGWAESSNLPIYKHQKLIGSFETTSHYKGEFNVEPKGTLEGWVQTVKDEVIGHTELELALAFGFSAAVVGMLSTIKDMDTLIVHICGQSTRGKTTAAQLAVSPFGRPSKTLNGLVKSWNATRNAIVTYLRNNYGLPIVLDEASMSDLKDFTTLIYTFAENREKDRMTKDGGLRKQGSWATTVISTAEHSIFQKTNTNEGLRVRAFEFTDTTWTTSGKHADALKDRLLKNYGQAVTPFVEHLQKLGVEEVEKRCKKWKETCEKTLSDSPFLTRVSEKFGLILAAAELVNDSLPFQLDLDALMNRLYDAETEIALERNQSDKALAFVIGKIIQHQEFFYVDQNNLIGRECWGRIKSGPLLSEVSILKHKFTELLTEAKVSDPKVVLRQWKEDGKLKTEQNKNTTRTKVISKELKKQSSVEVPTDSKGQSVVYTLLVDSATLKKFKQETIHHNKALDL